MFPPATSAGHPSPCVFCCLCSLIADCSVFIQTCKLCGKQASVIVVNEEGLVTVRCCGMGLWCIQLGQQSPIKAQAPNRYRRHWGKSRRSVSLPEKYYLPPYFSILCFTKIALKQANSNNNSVSAHFASNVGLALTKSTR